MVCPAWQTSPRGTTNEDHTGGLATTLPIVLQQTIASAMPLMLVPRAAHVHVMTMILANPPSDMHAARHQHTDR